MLTNELSIRIHPWTDMRPKLWLTNNSFEHTIETLKQKELIMTITAKPEQISEIVQEAREAAYAAAQKFFKEKLNGQDQYACGFAWVNIYGVRGNTKIGKALKACDIRPAYTGGLQMWNPSRFGCQNVDTLEVGAEAAAQVFRRYGFNAYAGSRLD